VLLSAVFHFILLSIAGSLVVFSVMKKEEKKFVPPPPIERPKMDLKKPRVKVKKTAKPSATQRIVSKNVQSMPEIQLPEISGMSAGLSGGIGGFEMMPDPAEMTLFGGKSSAAIGNDFEGTFYALELDRRGRMLDPMTITKVQSIIRRFMDADWNPIVFAPYYRASQKLYTTSFMIPPIPSEYGPEQFGVNLGENVSPAYWLIRYKGKIASKEGGTFRFRGAGDNYLVVRVNKEIVLVAGFGQKPMIGFGDWQSKGPESGKYMIGHGWSTIGDWFTLKPGVPVEMEVLAGDYEGGWFEAMVTVEDEKGKYKKNADGMPILPMFKTAEIPEPLIEKLEYLLIPDEIDLDDVSTFNVY
jgi:hypothetical protein